MMPLLPPAALEWLNLLLRWIHVLAAILWVGDSFLFMWMDSSLEPPRGKREGAVVGELWMVHSGGFYEVVKRKFLAPDELPPRLYWFMWQSYATWITGFLLFVVLYWLGGGALLVESGAALSHGQAVALSAALLVAGWIVYDAAWMSPLGKRPQLTSTLLLVVLAATVFGLTRVFGGRAAYLQTGVMLGTIMAANVWRRIIPAQDQMLAATRAGTVVDTSLGVRAKTRSIHNHYLTLPVLFIMLSHHYPTTYGNPLSWAVLLLLIAFGMSLKYVMNFRGRSDWRITILGVVSLLAAVALTLRPSGAPGSVPGGAVRSAVPFAQAQAIVERRCTTCHSAHPSNPSFPEPPNGVRLDEPDRMRSMAPRMLVRAVQTQTMPLGNLTGMTAAERDTLGAWITQGAK